MASAKARFLREYPEALIDDAGAVFVGAGVSMGAGYPSWSKLLKEIGEELGISSSDVHDLAALAQWSIQESGGSTRVRNVIKEQIGRDYPVPLLLKIVARLPLRHIWTTNYDRLIERAFNAISRPIDTVAGSRDLSLKAKPGATRLYKMHGSVERLDDIVISTDDYELFRARRGAYLPLLQAHMTSMSILFMGLSFTDPNIRHVLSLIRESFTDAPPEHFAIVRPPHREDFQSDAEHKARAAQHKLWARDLRRYGLLAVEIDDYTEVPDLLQQIERRVAQQRIWISGSWPILTTDSSAPTLYALAVRVGNMVGEMGRSLVSGGGEVIGSAAVAGFLDALRTSSSWDLERRLITRPFPQPLAGKAPDREQWTALREELARLSGAVIFLGGTKLVDGTPTIAEGVIEEYKQAKKAGAFLLPVGATGGAALQIANELVGSSLATGGPNIMRPTDDEIRALSNTAIDASNLVELLETILKRTEHIT